MDPIQGAGGLESEQKSSFVGIKRKSKHGGKSKRSKRTLESDDVNQRNPTKVLQDIKQKYVYSDAPRVETKNLAGRPDSLLRSEYKVRKNLVKIATPFHQSQNLGVETYLHFVVSSNRNEWMQLKPDSLSLVLYGTMLNPDYNAEGATAKIQARRHSLCARTGTPRMFIDPSVQLTGLVSHVEVTIDNVPVPTNSAIQDLMVHYVRYNRIFCKNPGPVLARTRQVTFTKTGAEMESPMTEAVAPFDYKAWNSRDGSRATLFLDGVFPFSTKNRTLEDIENVRAENLWLPPDTTVDIRVYLHRSKMEAIFHSGINSISEYFDKDHVTNAPVDEPQLTIESASLEYETVELNQQDHVQCLKDFSKGGYGSYRYDIPRGQHQTLAGGTSYTENIFQIMPFAKLAYIAFLPDWATIVMEAKRKPVSGLSRFPANASRIEVSFASEPLVVKEFENFGMRSSTHEATKKIYYQYLKKIGATSLSFEDFFPRHVQEGAYVADESMIQVFVFELSNHLSAKSELLKICCTFGGGNTSPEQTQVVVITVHPNGEARCKRIGEDRWEWSFAQNA